MPHSVLIVPSMQQLSPWTFGMVQGNTSLPNWCINDTYWRLHLHLWRSRTNHRGVFWRVDQSGDQFMEMEHGDTKQWQATSEACSLRRPT